MKNGKFSGKPITVFKNAVPSLLTRIKLTRTTLRSNLSAIIRLKTSRECLELIENKKDVSPIDLLFETRSAWVWGVREAYKSVYCEDQA
jgi:hypothetical protein